jgi:alpha-N-acetylglucosaminidase
MKLVKAISLWVCTLALPSVLANDNLDCTSEVDGLYGLVKRQLAPCVQDQIKFELDESLSQEGSFDSYCVSQEQCGGKVTITGSTKSALASGLYSYLRDYGHASISWTDSTLNKIEKLPDLCSWEGDCEIITGSAVVPFRYHFNTVTFGYTTPFYSWDDWEHLLDWLSLQGVNLPLAWVGYETILVEMLREFNFTDEQIRGFVSGPAFLPWNRFGNVQGDWNATLDLLQTSFLEDQGNLQKMIVKRMAELGMTPILPAFTGFVPREITEVHPDADVLNSSNWDGNWQVFYSNVTFLNPMDPLFTEMQTSFLTKQRDYFEIENLTHFFTLDQYNENNPTTEDLESLKEVSKGTIKALKEFDPNAVWVMQGWLFHYAKDYWSDDRIEAYLSGPEKGELLILDLYSEYSPQWERTNSYYGHDWIWSELHNFGSNMALEGSLQILSNNFTNARKQNSNLVGAGLTPEGHEGNEIAYLALLYQAWHEQPYEIPEFTKLFIESRYGPDQVPEELLNIWNDLVDLVYTNDYSTGVYANGKPLFTFDPALWGLEKKTSRSSIIFYDASKLEAIWQNLVNFIFSNPQWLEQPHFHYDVVYITSQVLANRFTAQYHDFVDAVNSTKDQGDLFSKGNKLAVTLEQLDNVLYTDKNFLLSEWIAQARNMASEEDTHVQDYYEFQARNQITMWGPRAEISEYASKSWAGLVGTYYKPIWQKFVNYVVEGNDANNFASEILPFRIDWQWQKWFDTYGNTGVKGSLLDNLKDLQSQPSN